MKKHVQKTDVFTSLFYICRQLPGGVFVALVLAIFNSIPAQAASTLGANALWEGPAAGSDSVVLAVDPQTAWTATTNNAWLHLSVANQSGTDSTNVVFSYDANPGDTRVGSLTIAGQTLTITQAAPGYAL
ncbi:MAG: BACON domain-containing protein, partial [Verrucomicrobiota bacterium]